MKKLLLTILVLFGLWTMASAQVEEIDVDNSWGSASDLDESDLDVISVSNDNMPTGRFKQPMQFTRAELNRIRDPRIRDMYWYALNDTTDRKRYLKVHYAFNRFRDNWAFQIGGGVNSIYLFGLDGRFGIGPMVEFGFKKDLHPYWAARLLMQGSRFSHYVYTDHISTFGDQEIDFGGAGSSSGKVVRQHPAHSALSARFDLMLNMVNLFHGREWLYSNYDVFLCAGAGAMYAARNIGVRDGSCFVPFWGAGVMQYWNLDKPKRFSIYLDLYCSWQSDDIEGFTTQNSTLKFMATTGISYKFSDKIHFQRLGIDEVKSNIMPVPSSEDDEPEISTYIVEHKNDTTATLPPDLIEAAFFQIDRIELAHAYVLNLGFYAKLIKSYPNQKFLVRGFADLEVGSLRRNLWLCQKRAEVVFDVLVKTYGVNPDQLVMGGGDLENELPFLRENGHHKFNRCVIVAPLSLEYQNVVNENTFEDNAELMDGRVKSNIRKNY